MNTHRNIKLLTWFNFLIEFKPYAPVIILYFKEVAGSFALGLSIFSIITISSALLEIPTGILSDRIGRKRTIMLGAVASVLGVSLWAFGGSYMFLVLGAVFIGLSEALFSGNNEALLYDTLKEVGKDEEFSESFGKVSSMLQMGLGLSALVGGYLTLWSFQTVLYVSVIPLLICLMLTLFLVEPKMHTDEITTNIFSDLRDAFAEFGKNKYLRLVSMTSILRNGIEEVMFQFTPVFISLLWPTWALGIIRFFTHAFSTASYWFSGVVIKKLGATRTAFIGNVFDRATGLAAVIFPSGISPILLIGPCYGLNEVAEETLLQNEFTDQQRATMASINSFLGSICFGLFAFVLGIIADSFGPRMGLLVGEIILLPVPFILWKVYKGTSDKGKLQRIKK